VHWSFLQNLPLSLATALAWTLSAFVIGRVVGRHSTIDAFWGAGFVVVYLESLVVARHVTFPPGFKGAGLSPDFAERYVVLGAVALWGVRLSAHLALRQRGSAEDSRYVAIMRGAHDRHETWYALRTIYALQAVLLWFVSMPLQWTAFHESFDALLYVGLALVAIGVAFEATGDEQLRRFLAGEANRGATMDRGLWRYTRHPNYFGDAVVWCGFYVVACSAGWGVATILSPILMVWLLTSLSGRPMLERKLASTRTGYEHYVATTSSFVPRPPKET
jgi:steroid 5-alpha reductase family enzyme